MPLDATGANTKTTAINEAFAKIGRSAAKMPPSKRNNEPVAWEYLVASHLVRIAETRKGLAVRAAIAAGVMFDHERQPLPEGTNALIYTGDVVEIRVEVTTPALRLDAAGFVADLEKVGVPRKLLDRALAANTKQNRAPHKFTSSLVTAPTRR